MEIDLHGYHPRTVCWGTDDLLTGLVEHAWEMGDVELCLIHGHGRNRGQSPGFVNINTGFLGLAIRRRLRYDPTLRKWIHHTTVRSDHPGATTVKLSGTRRRDAQNWSLCRKGIFARRARRSQSSQSLLPGVHHEQLPRQVRSELKQNPVTLCRHCHSRVHHET